MLRPAWECISGMQRLSPTAFLVVGYTTTVMDLNGIPMLDVLVIQSGATMLIAQRAKWYVSRLGFRPPFLSFSLSDADLFVRRVPQTFRNAIEHITGQRGMAH